MIAALSDWPDRFLGRGTASVTVPALDGALKPNSLLDEAPHGLVIAEPDNAVAFGDAILFSSGPRVMREQTQVLALQGPVTAMAASPAGTRLAVACADGALMLFGRDLQPVPPSLTPLPGVTALAFADETTLLASVGSAVHPPSEWQRDLLTHGRTGSLWRIATASGQAERMGGAFAFPYGILPDGKGGAIVSEAWAKRLLRVDGRGAILAPALDDLPGFPARLSPSAAGGSWLCVFAPRSQLIEFVLREETYRRAMMAEVDPRYWVAPALSSGTSFREPMQGGALKQMGMLKPWAPTRSYGLVIELDAALQPMRSLHSRAGGRRHGITSAVEHQGRLWLTSKGGGEVISLPARDQAI